MRMKDIKWEPLLEAPTKKSKADDLEASDYGDMENVDVDNNVEEDEDLAASDYGQDAAEGPDAEEPTDETEGDEELDDTMDEGLDDEAPTDGEEDLTGEDGNADENPEDEQPDNAEPQEDNSEEKKNNKYLVHDFIELYKRLEVIIDRCNNSPLNANRNPVYHQSKKNLDKLRDTLYDYIVDRFNEENYVFNLYQFNLFIQAINVNSELLNNSVNRTKEEKDKKAKKNKK